MAAMTRIDGGVSGKVVARVVLAGTACSGNGDASDFHGHGHGLRRATAVASVHDPEGNKGRVSVVSTESTVGWSEERKGQQHDAAVSSPTSGSGEQFPQIGRASCRERVLRLV